MKSVLIFSPFTLPLLSVVLVSPRGLRLVSNCSSFLELARSCMVEIFFRGVLIGPGLVGDLSFGYLVSPGLVRDLSFGHFVL